MIAIPEFSRPLRVDDLRPGGSAFAIKAKNKECRAVAARLGLEAVHELGASLILEPRKMGREVHLAGTLTSRITQICCITLEPFETTLESALDLVFAEEADREFSSVSANDDAQDLPEPILEGGVIDLGESVVQQLSLEMNPFPRAPGARFSRQSFDCAILEEVSENNADRPNNPFAALASLKDNLE